MENKDYVYIRFPADVYAELTRMCKKPMWVETLIENGMREVLEKVNNER